MTKVKHFFDLFLFQRCPDLAASRGRKAAFWVWNGLMLLCAALGVTVVMLLLAAGNYSLRVFMGYFTHPQLFLLNLIPVLLLMVLGWAVTGRPWAAYLFGAIPAMAFAFGNYYKMVFRNDPVMFGDLLILGEAGNMAGQYQLFLNGRLALVAGCVIAGLLALIFFVRGRPSGKIRLSALAAVILALVFGVKPYLSDSLYNATAVNLEYLSPWAATHQYVSRGALYPFFYSVKEAFPTAPEGYDKTETAQLLAQYEDGDIPEEQKVNIMGIMLEAFADFSEFESIEFIQDAYALYHALEEESYTGDLVTNIFAGGTVNSERAFLTGVSTQFNWRSSANSYPWYFKSQGYETSGDHPCYDWFYNRKNINSYLGLDDYRFVENYYSELTGYAVGMDNVFFPELTADFLSRLESDAPQFSFSVSYQGHGPYDSDVCWWGEVDDYIANHDLPEEYRYILANYLGSVMDTQQHLAELVDTLRSSQEPVVLIVFGDHMPWMGNGNTVYDALGISFDQSTEEGFYNYWSTRYLIWANDAAKEVLDFDFTGEGPDLSPCFLMGHLFDCLGWAGDAYTQATYEVRQTLPVIHDGGRCMENGALTIELTAEGQALLQRFRCLEYHRAKHFTYAN